MSRRVSARDGRTRGVPAAGMRATYHGDMSRQAVASLAVAAALVLATAAIVIIRAGDPSRPASGVWNDRSTEDVASYWTTERMRDASPG